MIFGLRTGDLVVVDVDSDRCRGYVPSMVRYDVDPTDRAQHQHDAGLEVRRTSTFVVLHVHPSSSRWLLVCGANQLGWLSLGWVEQAWRDGARIDPRWECD